MKPQQGVLQVCDIKHECLSLLPQPRVPNMDRKCRLVLLLPRLLFLRITTSLLVLEAVTLLSLSHCCVESPLFQDSLSYIIILGLERASLVCCTGGKSKGRG